MDGIGKITENDAMQRIAQLEAAMLRAMALLDTYPRFRTSGGEDNPRNVLFEALGYEPEKAERLSAEALVKMFNQQYPVGSRVLWRPIGGATVPFEWVTVSVRAILIDGAPVSGFEEREGFYSIEPEFLNYHMEQEAA